MIKKILIAFEDIGACQQLLLIAQYLKSRGIEVLVVAGSGCWAYLSQDMLVVKGEVSEEIFKQIGAFQAQLLLMGNSVEPHSLEKPLLRFAKEKGLPTVQFVDFWGAISSAAIRPQAYLTFDTIGYRSLLNSSLSPVYCVGSPKHMEYQNLSLIQLQKAFFSRYPKLASSNLTTLFLQSEKYLPGHQESFFTYLLQHRFFFSRNTHLLLRSHPSYPEDKKAFTAFLSKHSIPYSDVSSVPIEEVFSVTRYAISVLSTSTIDFQHFCGYLSHRGRGIFLCFHSSVVDRLCQIHLIDSMDSTDYTFIQKVIEPLPKLSKVVDQKAFQDPYPSILKALNEVYLSFSP